MKLDIHVQRGAFRLDVSDAWPEHGVTALFGPSGAGKTTLLRALAGLETHPGCHITFGEETWQAPDLVVPPHRRGVGFVFQDPALFPHLSVRQNLAYAGKRAAMKRHRIPDLPDITRVMELDALLDRRPDSLSGGERQRVAIARALASAPRLLLLDEPLASLDTERKERILSQLMQIRREWDIPIVLVSHDLADVVRLTDHIVLIDEGCASRCAPFARAMTDFTGPLAHRADAAVPVDVTADAHDAETDMSRVRLGDGHIWVPGGPYGPDYPLRLVVHADRIMLARAPVPPGTDGGIVVPCTVRDVVASGVSTMIIALRSGSAEFLARTTRRTVSALQLEPGLAVFAHILGAVVH